MNILIVDDHAIVVEGVKSLVGKGVSGANTLTATLASKAAGLLESGGVDILITDLDLRGESGLSLIARAREACPQAKAIVYTMHEEPWTIREIADADPDAVVMKGDAPQELLAAIEALAGGRGYYSPTFVRHLAALGQHPDRLSQRERDVLALIAQGLSTADAALRLGVSPSTVDFHRRRIMQKLGAANAAEMVGKATRMGWDANL